MAGRPGRPPKDLSPFQDEILELVNEGYTNMTSNLILNTSMASGLDSGRLNASVAVGASKKSESPWIPVNFEIESRLCLKKVVSWTKRSCGIEP